MRVSSGSFATNDNFLRVHWSAAAPAHAPPQFAIESILWRNIERNPSLRSKIMTVFDPAEAAPLARPARLRIS
jgi:hypothetical protein